MRIHKLIINAGAPIRGPLKIPVKHVHIEFIACLTRRRLLNNSYYYRLIAIINNSYYYRLIYMFNNNY